MTPFGFPKGLELVGVSDSISRQLETLQHAQVLENLELFASKVMPRFS